MSFTHPYLEPWSTCCLFLSFTLTLSSTKQIHIEILWWKIWKARLQKYSITSIYRTPIYRSSRYIEVFLKSQLFSSITYMKKPLIYIEVIYIEVLSISKFFHIPKCPFTPIFTIHISNTAYLYKFLAEVLWRFFAPFVCGS